MDIQTFLGVLGRRWWVVLPALLVVAGLTLGVANLVKPTYKATSTLVLYAPPSTDTNTKTAPDTPANPILGLGGLSDVTAVMVARMGDPDAVQAIGQSKGWTVTNDDSSSAPLLYVTADKNTPELALATLDRVDSVIEQQLVDFQLTKGVAPSAVIHSKLVSKDKQASVVQGSRLRAMVATLVLGIILTASLAFAVDSFANARAARRGSRRRSRRARRRGQAVPIENQDADESTVVAPVKHRRIRGA